MRRLWWVCGLNVLVTAASGVAATAVVGGGAHAGQSPLARPPDAGCSLEATRGNYAGYGHGVLFGVPWALVGTVNLDGKGIFTGTATESVGGVIDSGNSFAGTYTMGPDCRGTATFDMVHETRFDGHSIELVAADGGRRVMWLLTDTRSRDLPTLPQADEGATTISGWMERM